MPWPRVLVLEEDSEAGSGVMLFRYGGTADDFGGDTWHEDVAAAKEMAAWEYEDLLEEWEPVPDDEEDAVTYAVSRILPE